MKTISTLVDEARDAAGNYGELANLMPGAKGHIPRDWAKRCSIPSDWVMHFCNACAGLGLAHVTPGLIAEMQARALAEPTDKAA